MLAAVLLLVLPMVTRWRRAMTAQLTES